MYGLVNKAVQELVVNNYGQDMWEKIKSRADIGVEEFICMSSYPDDVTYSLVGAAAAELGISADAVLTVFGEYWIEYAGKEGYGELLSLAGDDLVEVLENLEDLHTRVGLSFPDLRMPHFKVSDIEGDTFLLHYRSEREGLGGFVNGLLYGLGKMFKMKVEVTWSETKADGADHDVFLVKHGPAVS